jgi:predicted TIM-barrel fold metal-dependent hydrolase
LGPKAIIGTRFACINAKESRPNGGAIMLSRRRLIIDFHTHIFPPEVRAGREEYLRRDPTFAEMYASPRAKIATAEDLLASMDAAGVDVSVALGFAWRDHDLCVRHNDYLLEAAARSGGRIVPFCTVNPAAPNAAKEVERCGAAGARGLGELRPDSQGWNPNHGAGEELAAAAVEHNLMLLFHVSEPVGRSYPGKEGGKLGDFFRFVRRHTGLTVIGAHLAGGLPLYVPAPHVRDVFSRVYVDTAAQPLLYDRAALDKIVLLTGPEHVLLGSDYPLISQKRQIQELRSGTFSADDVQLMLGANAERLLGPVRARP